MLASENPLLLGSSGHTELAEGALDGSVVGCQPQTFSRSASSATCSRLSLPLSSRTLLLGRPTEVLLAPPESALLPRFFRHLAHIHNAFSLVHPCSPPASSISEGTWYGILYSEDAYYGPTEGYPEGGMER